MFINTHFSFAQKFEKPLRDFKLVELKGFAKNALRLGDGYAALYYYKEWANRKPKNLAITYQVAELYNYTRNYPLAEAWYKKIPEKEYDKFPLTIFYLARSQMAQEKYVEAKQNFVKFKKILRNVSDIYYRDQYKKGLASCDFALSLKDSVSTAVLTHLNNSINKPHIEFSPVLLDQNTLLYGSLDVEGVDFYNINKEDSTVIPYRKYYLAKKKNDVWEGKGELNSPINIEGKDVGSATLSSDKTRLYFTVCQKNWRNDMICHLYYSIKRGKRWSDPIKMNDLINVPNSTTSQPTIGIDSRTNSEIIYFVSDRPGGRGGLDIWYTEYNKRKRAYKNPKNAGSRINTKGDEATPFYDKTTRNLYYSSNGKIGLGGYDVFKTSGEKRKWEKSVHMGKGINSSYDDLDFILNHDKSGGFLVSNRKGGRALLSETCCDDIYEFIFSNYIKIDLIGEVNDSIQKLRNYDLKLYLKNKRTGEKFVIQNKKIDQYGFNFTLDQGYDYEIVISKKGYYKNSIEFSTKNIEKSITLEELIMLEPIPQKPFILKGILYEFDSDKLTKSSKTIIDTTLLIVLNEKPNIVIQISSHTDSKGGNNYNLDLSKRRAKSVVNYLIRKGISPERLNYEGYGENKPIAPNTKPDGSDNPDGRRLNRRTDFTILRELETKPYAYLLNKDDSKMKRKKNVRF